MQAGRRGRASSRRRQVQRKKIKSREAETGLLSDELIELVVDVYVCGLEKRLLHCGVVRANTKPIPP